MKLVRFYDGVDGLKTGHTEEAGYCLTATAKKNNMRIIAVAMGEPTSKTRNQEISEMLDYAFAQYQTDDLLRNIKIKDKYPVDKGEKEYIYVKINGSATALQKKGSQSIKPQYEIKINDIKAPLKKGDKIGTLTIKNENKIIKKVDIVSTENIKKASFIKMYLRCLKDMLTASI